MTKNIKIKTSNKTFLTNAVLCSLICVFSILPVKAYEDCIIMSSAKLTDINIEDNSITDILPLTTIMNDKNTLIVHPLKEGKTRFCVLKNGKNLALFNIEVSKYGTVVNAPDGFEVFTLDVPENIEDYGFELDTPPALLKSENIPGEING